MKPLFLIVGPSGCGKSTFANELAKVYNYNIVQSYTTRPRRFENETGHIFISPEQFDTIRDKLIAYTLFNNYEYGITADILDQNDIYIIDLDGLRYLKQKYNTKRNLIIIGVDASVNDCYKAMIDRGDSEEIAQQRINHDKIAFKDFQQYCDIVIRGHRPLELMLDEFKKKLKNYVHS